MSRATLPDICCSQRLFKGNSPPGLSRRVTYGFYLYLFGRSFIRSFLFIGKVTQIRAELDNLARFAFGRGIEPLRDGIRFLPPKCLLQHFFEGLHSRLLLEVRPIRVWEHKYISVRGSPVYQRVPIIMDRPLCFLDCLGAPGHGAAEILTFSGTNTEGDD